LNDSASIFLEVLVHLEVEAFLDGEVAAVAVGELGEKGPRIASQRGQEKAVAGDEDQRNDDERGSRYRERLDGLKVHRRKLQRAYGRLRLQVGSKFGVVAPPAFSSNSRMVKVDCT
jgi:hypothetical protein